ncbi:hypothetical protein V6N13_020245 [Hibiscus sabdariffa]
MQGCVDPKFLNALRQYLRDNKPDVVGLVEPCISGYKADSIISSLRFPHSHRIEAAGFSGGLWLCWFNVVSIDILVNHFQFIHFRINCVADECSSLATLIYASSNATKRKILWSHLGQLASTIHQPWLLFGDFNATLSADDRIGCAPSTTPCSVFRQFLFDFSLQDMDFSGPEFTWQRGQAQARLDRFLCNSYWDEAYPESSVMHLLRMRSDHQPLLLWVGLFPTNRSKPPFRYFTGWQYHERFRELIQDNWIHSGPLPMTIRTFTAAAELWNAHVFELLHYEELLWRQKSCSDWIQLGDRSTSYFHKKAKIRKVRNRITSLKISDGSWCDDEVILKDEAVAYYKSLFSLNQLEENASTYYSMFPDIGSSSLSHLDAIPSPDEIYGGSNFCRWHWDDRFTISSAYAKCVEHTLPPCSSTWNVIWKSQNGSIFSRFDTPVDNTASRVITWSRHYSIVSTAAHAQHTVHSATASRWSAPSPPWICLNTDGSSCFRSNYARAGGVIRDSNGAWIAGFDRGIDIADAFTTEL